MKKKVRIILIVSVVLALILFLAEYLPSKSQAVVTRNDYGEGQKAEEYELSIEGEPVDETIRIEVGELEYTHEEIQEIFEIVMKELDVIVLGENENFDHVEKNLNLVTQIESYPVTIQWQLDSYSVINANGEVQEEYVDKEGTLVELRGTIFYRTEQAIYIRSAKVYPLTRVGMDKVLYEIEQEILRVEEKTRQESTFTLPTRIDGKNLQWSKKKSNHWQYILVMGIALSVYLIYREREKVKRKAQQRTKELLRDYPGMISKFTMLLGTGATVRHAFETIVQNYEQQKEQLGSQVVYEEIKIALHEMKGGISEAEAYERFGKRCGVTVYMKFGALLAQNLRKGSRGISEILRVEAMQAFENRKNTAKRMGEEVGMKLLMPMLGMLAVVFIIIMVPAFLTMQL